MTFLLFHFASGLIAFVFTMELNYLYASFLRYFPVEQFIFKAILCGNANKSTCNLCFQWKKKLDRKLSVQYLPMFSFQFEQFLFFLSLFLFSFLTFSSFLRVKTALGWIGEIKSVATPAKSISWLHAFF